MHRDLHALGTSHTWVSGDKDEPKAKSLERGIGGPFIAKGHVTEACVCRDITYDVTALINDVTSKNKMMHFGRSASKVRYHEIA